MQNKYNMHKKAPNDGATKKTGSGGWLPTLSSLLFNALDIAANLPPLPTSISALLSSSPTSEGVHALEGADYTRTSAIPTSGGR
jgi:hypothetical protein